jgi:hypothetical protein
MDCKHSPTQSEEFPDLNLSTLFDGLVLTGELTLPSMDAYAQPNERQIGKNRPRISHLPPTTDTRTHSDRQREKEGVAAARRRIKKSARRHLQRELQRELRNAR